MTTKARPVALAGATIQHYCDRCRGRFRADCLNAVWGRIVCDECLSPDERRQKEMP